VDNPPNTYVEKIEERILKMDDFIKSMLDYSRASRLTLKYQEVDIEELIDGCISDLEFLEGFETVDIIKNISRNGHKVMVDIVRVKIILSNIISNVFKYRNTETDGSFLKIQVNVTDVNINIEIQDNGIGIAKEHLGKVFDMFYRATEKSDGSGLGMYIVKQSIDKLHGEVQVESEEMIGTTFKIEIPNHLD
jgi:signal transduction histidine kinase